MAAKSLEGANQVWERVSNFMLTKDGSPVSSAAFLRQLKHWLSTQKGNPKLQLLTFTDVTADQATALTTGGATLYAIFVKKQNTATDSFFKWNDHGTTAGGGNGATMQGTLPLLVGNDEVSVIFQPGLILATGFTVAAETTAAGGADTVTGDGPNGFAIIG